MTQHLPAKVFPPGDYIADEMAERGWSAADLARTLQLPVEHVSDLISGRLPMSQSLAEDLGAAFGTSADVWVNLENRYGRYQSPRSTGNARRGA